MTTAVLRSASPVQEPKGSLVALATFETRVILRHRLLWFGAVVSAAWAVWEIRQEAPVLNRVSVTLAWTMLPLAAAVALVAGWEVFRARGRTDADPSAITPMGMDRRVAGIILGLAGPALLTLAVQLGLLAWTVTRDPVTSLVWAEILAGPLLVACAGATAAALTRWIPHPSTPLFAVFVFAGSILIPYNQLDWGRRRGPEFLSPLAWPQGIVPYEVTFRPASLHLAYLALLVVAVGSGASLGRRVSGWFLAAVTLLAAIALGFAQLGPIAEPERVAAIGRLVGDNADLTCERHLEVVFCALPGYNGWIGDWVELAAPTIQAAPTAATEGMQVRQYPLHNTIIIGGGVPNEWWWYEASQSDLRHRDVAAVGTTLADYSYYELVPAVAAQLVNCDLSQWCGGEARTLVFTWLMAHHPQLYDNIVGSAGQDSTSVEACMVSALWATPNARQRVHQNWVVLTDPATSFVEAGRLLDVSVPTAVDADGLVQGGCP